MDSAAPAAAIRKLEDDQLKQFDKEHLTGEMWARLGAWIGETFPDGRFSFLDVGGGNGGFTDTVLERFPHAAATVLDNAEVLLSANKPHPRKTLICDSAENLRTRCGGRTFDLICFNFALHHFVLASYRDTRELQADVLAASRDLLSASGRLSIFELLYDGTVFRGLPGWLIHRLTSSRVLARLIRRLGANTAGCGVCFLNGPQWRSKFRRVRLDVARSHVYEPWPMPLPYRLGLHLRSVRVGQFWLSTGQQKLPPISGRA